MTSETASHYWICGTCRTANATGVTRCRACGRSRQPADAGDMGDAEVRMARPLKAGDRQQGVDRREPAQVTAAPGRRTRQHRGVLIVAAIVCLVPVMLLLLGVRPVSALAVWLAGLLVLVGLEVYWRRGHSFREDLRDIRAVDVPPVEPERATAGLQARPPSGPSGSVPPAGGQPGPSSAGPLSAGPPSAAPSQPAPPQVVWRPPELRRRGLSETTAVPPSAPSSGVASPPAAVPAGTGALPAPLAAPSDAPPATPAKPPAPIPRPDPGMGVAIAPLPVGLSGPPAPSAAPVSVPGAGDERCPHCGAPIDAGWDLCPSCGHRFPLSRLATWSPPTAPRSGEASADR
jgi:hypothetical protein